MKPLIFLFLCTLASLDAIHRDTILQIDANGNINGLPKKFTPAKFEQDKARLRVNSNEIVLPECVMYFFKEHKNPTLRLSASWYHSKIVTPYYLNFYVSDPEVNYGYSILIDLETLDLIEIEKSTQEGSTTYYKKVDPGQPCLEEYKGKIRKADQ